MKVFICVILFAAIASAVPVKNTPAPEPTESAENPGSSTELIAQPNPLENPNPIEDLNTQSENADRNKRFVFFSKYFYSYSTPVVYSTRYVDPVVTKIIYI